MYMFIYIHIYIGYVVGWLRGRQWPTPIVWVVAWRGSTIGYRHNGPCGPNKYRKY